MPGYDGEKLPFGVTTRSRRRRKAKAVVVGQKENLADNDSSIVPKSQIPHEEEKSSSTNAKPRRTKANAVRATKGQKKKTPPAPSKDVWIYACKESHDEVLRQFRMSLDKVPVKDLKAWKDDQYTSQDLIEGSLSLSKSNNKEASPVLLGHDEDSYKDILNICRKVIKSATERRAKDVETAVHGLYVALHGLRALSVASTEDTRAEDIMRLLYHLITTAATAHKDLVEPQFQGKVKRRKKVDNTIMLAENICLRGYETLCYVLLDYSLVLEESNQVVEFTFLKDDNNSQILWLSMLPVPNISQRRGSNKARKQSTMKVSQLFSIGVQSTLAVARTFIDASSPNGDGPKQFLQESKESSFLPTLPSLQAKAVNMLRIITFSWASFVSFNVPDKEETTTKEIVSICQQVHRILWGLASKISTVEKKSQSEERYCMETALEIHKHSLLALLGFCKVPSNTSMDSCLNFQSQAGKMLATKFFDNVCTMAWKASVSSGAKEKDVAIQQPTLYDFHVSVGSVLDKIADLLNRQESFPYIEYCAYRALSIGSSVSCEQATKSTCRPNHAKCTCIFAGLPFPFTHRCPLDSEAMIGAGKKDLLNSVTLSVFFFSLQLRNDLEQMLRRIQGQDEKPNHYNHQCAHESHAAGIFQVFERVFLFEPQVIPLDDKLRCFKLLSMVSLQSTIYQVSTASCHDLLPNDAVTLGICTEFLARCFGPFALSILTCGRSLEEKRVAHLCDIVVESYGRPAIVWDNLSVAEDVHPRQDYIERSNSAMLALKDILVSPDTTKLLNQKNVIDKAAKIFASIGKRRASRANKVLSVSPMLHSLSLFIKSASIVNPACDSKSQGSENHLLARWSYVAGVFHSLKWHDASLLASAVALNCFFASTCSAGGSGVWVDVVRDLGSKTHGVLPIDYRETRLPDNIRVLIRRITRSSLGRRTTTPVDNATQKRPLQMQDVIDMLSCLVSGSNSMMTSDDSLSSSFQGVIGCQFSLVGVLQALFEASGMDATAKIRLLASLLSPLGQTLQRNTSTESTISAGEQEDYEGLVNLLIECINSIPAVIECDGDQNQGEISATVTRSTAYIVAACNILSETEVHDHLLLGTGDANTANMDPCSASLLSFAANFATQAREALMQQNNADYSRDLFYSALRSSILVVVDTLKSLLGDSDSPNHGESLVAHFDVETIHSLGSQQEIQVQPTEFARFCLIRTLRRVRDRLAFQGDKLFAAQVALWLQRLSSSTRCNVDHQWTSTRLSHLLVSADLAEVAEQNEMQVVGDEEDFLEGTQTAVAESEFYNQLVQIEAHIESLRFKLHHSANAIYLESVDEELNALLRHVESIQEESEDAGLTSLALWVKSSALLLLSEVAEIAGNLSGALSGTRQSFQTYQETINSAKVAFSSTWDEVTAEQPFLRSIVPTLIVGSIERGNECLQRMSTLNAIIGDYRKCEVYALCAMKNSGTHGRFEQLKPNTPLPELLALLREVSPGSRNELTCRRGFLWSRATATACDLVLKEFQDVATESASFTSLAKTSFCSSSLSLCDKLDEIGDIFVVGNIFHSIQISPARTAAVTAYERASAVYEDVTSEKWFQRLSEAARVVNPPSSGRLLTAVLYQNKLGEIRTMLENLDDTEPEAQEDATAACLDLSQANYAPKECRAWAFYYLGLIALHTARKTNALASLWAGCSNETSISCSNPPDASESLRRAREHFNEALALLGPASQMLTRMVLRSLALVTGPERHGKVSADSASILINTSIGCTARQMLGQLSNDSIVETNDESTPSDLLEALDVGFSQPATRENHVNNFLDALVQLAPPGWRFVASTICPTGEVLISSICSNRTGQDLIATSVCHFPENKSVGTHFLYSNQTYDSMMKPLDSVMLRSQQHLRDGPSSDDAQAKQDDVSMRREWWKERSRFDDELQHLLSHVEGEYFDSRPARLALFGHDDVPGALDDSFTSSNSSGSSYCGDLTSKFEAVSLNLFADSSNTPAAKRRTARSTAPPTTGRKSKRLDISSISMDDQEERQYQPSDFLPDCDHDLEATTCTLLFLDENLSRFPFEGLPSFANRPVCRFPSLPFALASLHNHSRPTRSMPVIDPARASYVIDPEGNLNATQERLADAIHRHRWSWEGVSGEVPSVEFMKENLAKENGFLLYCGHGSGQTFFSRSQVEELMKQKWSSDEEAPCQSSVILMGCSSGRLESVNRKGSDELSNHAIFYEPEGIALSYLLAGAPCVVGNLWDVTDHDIDRYCLDLLERLAKPDSNGRGVSIAGAVAQARSSCKMTYINGCAPVCYGLPVEVLQSHSR